MFQKAFRPTVPNDTVLSFYIQAQKLVLAVYHLYVNQSQKIDIASRYQVCVGEDSPPQAPYVTSDGFWVCSHHQQFLVTRIC